MSAILYAKKVRETPMDRGFEKFLNFLKDKKLLAGPFDKECDIWFAKETTYPDKLNKISASEFEARNGESHNLTIKTEKPINRSLLQLRKQEKTREKSSQAQDN